MHRLRTVTSLDVSAVAGHHAMPAALLFVVVVIVVFLICKSRFEDIVLVHLACHRGAL